MKLSLAHCAIAVPIAVGTMMDISIIVRIALEYNFAAFVQELRQKSLREDGTVMNTYRLPWPRISFAIMYWIDPPGGEANKGQLPFPWP